MPGTETAANAEIEITPEMVEAGLIEFHTYDSRVEFPEEAVRKIYTAMRLAAEPDPSPLRPVLSR